MTNDLKFIRYTVARLASFRNVWWSLSNEWNQVGCKWDSGTPPNKCFTTSCPTTDAVNVSAATPIWDSLFESAKREDPYGHMMSIHNNAFLYNLSRPWITHFSIQHTHNQPKELWKNYGKKPVLWDEVKYEGNSNSNWGSLSALQMVQRMWWGACGGAYGQHDEVLSTDSCCDDAAPLKVPRFARGVNVSWNGSGGCLCGEAAPRIAWFHRYISNQTINLTHHNGSTYESRSNVDFAAGVGHDDGQSRR